ncbi:DUF2225 domain-containing protein [Kitasatospora sp. NPDC056181]|uniref:DUF2225 domain-containing protein n=1 Tax=Kitasatospora sp. NPDC056181 TaxID=3345737 RepID=UPI0035DC2AFE
MTTTFSATFNCPNCRRKFDSEVLGSTNNFGGVTTEFQQVAGGMQPLGGLIFTCPDCGFTGWQDAYRHRVAKTVSRLIAERITPLVRDERSSASRRYEYAAWIAKWRGDNLEEIGDLYLHAAWAWHDEPESEEGVEGQEHYRRQAIEYFEQAISSGVLPRQHALTLAYIVGEQYRRVGEPTEAARWYDYVIEFSGNDENVAQLAELALQQKTDPQEFIN